jgi:hypothetical protein
MKKLNIASNMVRCYKNNGQHAEQLFRYYLTGKVAKADNLPADKGCDLGHYSIKSARASVCKGRDIVKHLESDKATEFVYITVNEIAYIMNRQEYVEFVKTFGTVTRESTKNGGAEKIRLKHESKEMLEWLEERANK